MLGVAAVEMAAAALAERLWKAALGLVAADVLGTLDDFEMLGGDASAEREGGAAAVLAVLAMTEAGRLEGRMNLEANGAAKAPSAHRQLWRGHGIRLRASPRATFRAVDRHRS